MWTRDGLVLKALRARIAGGELRARAQSSARFGGMLARVTLAEIGLSEIERVADELQGDLFADASFWLTRDGAPGASVRARVESPRYEVLHRLAERFSRYGLKAPQRDSEHPLTAALRWRDGRLEIRDVEARTEAFEARAYVTRSALGLWDGHASVTAKQAFLETSHLFERASRWFGDVRIPIRVEGADGRVRVHADFLAALDAVLGRTRLGRNLQRAIDGLLARLDLDPQAPSSPPRHHAPSTLTSSDALIDRVARGEPEADAAIGALLERGYEPAEIIERVNRRR